MTRPRLRRRRSRAITNVTEPVATAIDSAMIGPSNPRRRTPCSDQSCRNRRGQRDDRRRARGSGRLRFGQCLESAATSASPPTPRATPGERTPAWISGADTAAVELPTTPATVTATSAASRAKEVLDRIASRRTNRGQTNFRSSVNGRIWQPEPRTSALVRRVTSLDKNATGAAIAGSECQMQPKGLIDRGHARLRQLAEPLADASNRDGAHLLGLRL